MAGIFESFSLLDKLFVLTASAGTFAVLVRAVLLLAGGDLDGDAGGGLEDDLDGEGAGDGFQFLSVLGLSSFFMMFGLVGIALSRQSQVGTGWAILGGLLAGVVAIWVIARVFRLGRQLQSSGNIPPQAAVGCFGTVYMTIPAGGTGRVNVRIGQRIREMDAMNAEGTELPTGTSIQVVRVDRVLAIVQPLSSVEL